MEPWSSPKPSLPLLGVLDYWLVSSMMVGLFSRLPWYWVEENGNKANENPTKLSVLIEIQSFFLNKCSLDCCDLINFD